MPRGHATEGADILIVGGGGAALAAALGAAEAGASVVLLEKEPFLGGTTGMSIGSFTAAGTPWQRRAGVMDSTEQHFRDLDLFVHEPGTVDNRVLRRLLVERAPQTLEWLAGMGMVFGGPSPEPPHTKPRMHNILPDSRAYVRILARNCRRRGVDIRTATVATRLVEEGGRVVAVEARGASGETVRFSATRGVVLASGDYSASEALRARFLPETFRGVRPMNAGNTGEGHQIALDIGARVLNAALVMGPDVRFPKPERQPITMRLPPTGAMGRIVSLAMRHLPRALLQPFVAMYMTARLAPSLELLNEGAILVATSGQHIQTTAADAAFAIARQADGVGWFIFDEELARKFNAWPHFLSTAPGIAYAYLRDYRRYRPDVIRSADTIAALARQCGIPAARLEQTVEAARADGKSLAKPPFTALGPAPSWIATTEGGLAVDESLRVLRFNGENDQKGEPIRGLYAAGSAGQGGLQIPGHGHHLAWAFTSGRIAGANAARADA